MTRFEQAMASTLLALWRPCGKRLAELLLCCASSVGAAAPNTEGILRPVGEHCFKTGSKAVPELCGTLIVHWRLWTLMGEPVGNYGLVWSLKSLRIQHGDGQGSTLYALTALPNALAQAARSSELTVEGLAYVQSGNQARLALAIDTGAPARPDGKVSFNVPGSPNWDAFIIQGSRHGDRAQAWCDEAGRSHLSSAQAKAMMRAGLQLNRLEICPRSSASTGRLEAAIQKYCKRGGNGAFCAVKTSNPRKVPAADATERQIDHAFAQLDQHQGRKTAAGGDGQVLPGLEDRLKGADMARTRQLEQEAQARQMQVRRAEAEQACEALREQRDTCLAAGCGRQPSKTLCTDRRLDDSGGGNCPPGRKCLFIPTYVCHAHAANPDHARWSACSAQPKAQCASVGLSAHTTVAQCVAQRLKSAP